MQAESAQSMGRYFDCVVLVGRLDSFRQIAALRIGVLREWQAGYEFALRVADHREACVDDL